MSVQVLSSDDGLHKDPMKLLKLQNIAYHCVTNNLDVISNQNYKLNDEIIIPSNICDGIIEGYQKFHGFLDEKVINLFCDTDRTRLRFIHLNSSQLTDEGLEILLKHNLYSLSLWYCNKLTLKSHHLITKYGESLHYLELGIGTNLFHDDEYIGFQLKCPNLRRLVLNGLEMHRFSQFDSMDNLIHLDLTSCNLANYSLKNLSALCNLEILVLHNVWPIEKHLLDEICQMSNLHVLDISVNDSENGYGNYNDPDQTLEQLFKMLPKLTHLDISGTNLSGNFHVRNERPLQYLGLYGTTNMAYTHENIPAIEIAGNANEAELLTALRYNRDRPAVLIKVLRDLLHFIRFNICKETDKALDALLAAMDRHPNNKSLHSWASRIVLEILNRQIKLGIKQKNDIIRTILNSMEIHGGHHRFLRIGLQIFSKLPIVGCVFFEHERLVTLFLHGISRNELEYDVQNMSLNLLMLLVQKDNSRIRLTDLGIVDVLLFSIRERLERSLISDFIARAWIVLKFIIFNSDISRQKFIKSNGVECLFKCLDACSNYENILENLMILLFVASETKWWKSTVMTPEFIKRISEFLSSQFGLFVRFYAAGVLFQLNFDKDEDWILDSLFHENFVIQMREATESLNLLTEQSLQDSFLEILFEMIPCYDSPKCQLWVVWILYYLISTDMNKYCQLIDRVKGIDILTGLTKQPKSLEISKYFAKKLINLIYMDSFIIPLWLQALLINDK